MGQKGVRVDGSPYDGIGSSSRSGIPGTVRLGGTFPGTSTKVTADLLWHFNFAIDRGYWVGDGEGMRTLGGPTPRFDALFVPNSRWPLSKGNDWVLAHCPPEELQPLDASESIHQFVQGLSLADGRALVVEGFAAWGASMPQLKKDAFAAQVSEVMAGGGRGVPAERSAGWLKYIQEIDSGKLTAERNALWQLWVAGKGPVPGAAPTLVATAGTPVAAPVAPSTTGTGTRRPLPFPLPPTALRP
jgi:hypothetical protein